MRWSRSFDRDFNDVLAARAEMAIGSATSLVSSLDPMAGLSGSGTGHPEACERSVRREGRKARPMVPATP